MMEKILDYLKASELLELLLVGFSLDLGHLDQVDISCGNWDKKFRKKIKDMGIVVKMYKRYVDDILLVTNIINKGWHYNGKRMEFLEARARDDILSDEERTARVII